MNALTVLALFAAIAVSLAANNECHLVDCGNTYKASTKETCVAMAEWRKCVWAQTTEQDGLCNAVGIAAAKKAVEIGELAQGCNSANGINASIVGSLIVAMVAVFFRS